MRLQSLRDPLEVYEAEILTLEDYIHHQLKDDPGYLAIMKIEGVGKVIGAIFVAEIGDVTRFSEPEEALQLGRAHPQAPRVRRQGVAGIYHPPGLPLVRWAAIEAISKYRGCEKLRADFHAIAARAAKFKARVAVARKLLTLVYYGLGDGEVRSLQASEAA